MNRRRRSKKPASPGAGKTEHPAPLQPMYPEDAHREEQHREAMAREATAREAVPREIAPREAEAPAAEVPSAPETGAPVPAAQRARKRRRGGKGRKPKSAIAKPVVTSEPADADEFPDAPSAALPDAPEPQIAAVPAAKAAAHSAPVAHPAQGKRTPKGTAVLTIGLPGSGKTSWFRRRAITPLSSDLLRMLLFDDISEQRYQDLVFSTLRYLLRARMIARMPWNYVDATNLSPRERRGWIKMAQEFGYEVHAVFFDVPVEVCMERNQKRGRLVPEDVMQRMAQKLRPPTFEEGFTKITVVRVKKQPARAVEPGSGEPDNEVQDVEEPGGPGLPDENY